jgi:hypothetical protein
MSANSHRQHILDHLLAGNKITPVQALNNGWGFRLSERIREIEAQGFEIDRAWYKTEGGAEVMQYWLRENQQIRMAI